jgi:hypothetical protein
MRLAILTLLTVVLFDGRISAAGVVKAEQTPEERLDKQLENTRQDVHNTHPLRTDANNEHRLLYYGANKVCFILHF